MSLLTLKCLLRQNILANFDEEILTHFELRIREETLLPLHAGRVQPLLPDDFGCGEVVEEVRAPPISAIPTTRPGHL